MNELLYKLVEELERNVQGIQTEIQVLKSMIKRDLMEEDHIPPDWNC